MIDDPKTLEEAKHKRYGKWSGCPKGTAYDISRCAYEVYPGSGWIQYQCKRSHNYGPERLYCKQHAKRVCGKEVAGYLAVDHIDGNPYNNDRENLRIVDVRDNR